MDAIVVGAGVSGLSCAVRLLERGLSVRVLFRDPPERTVSAVAGGLWLPYACGPAERALAWAVETLAELDRLAAEPGAGVGRVEAILLDAAPGAEPPWWSDALPPERVRPARPDELPHGYASARVVRVPLVETPRYLQRLAGRVRELGGALERRELRSLDELAGAARVVVCCAGIGARELAGDAELRPVRGTVLHVLPRPGARLRCLVDDEGPNALAYVLPRADVCVLGGTADAGAWDERPRADEVETIWRRCVRIEPELEGARRVRALTGLRPARDHVRLEAGRLAGGTPVVHDYGHGGGGLTLSWGCAGEAAQLAAELAAR